MSRQKWADVTKIKDGIWQVKCRKCSYKVTVGSWTKAATLRYLHKHEE